MSSQRTTDYFSFKQVVSIVMSFVAAIVVTGVLIAWQTSCGPKLPPAVLDPLIAACATDLAQWSYIQTLAPQLNLTPDELARALCSMPAVLLPYKEKAVDASARARAVVKSMSGVDAGTP